MPSLRTRPRLLRFLIQTPGAASPLPPIDGVSQVYKCVTGKQEFLSALRAFSCALSLPLQVPVALHITAHGNSTGIGVGETVSWSDLAPSLVALNSACDGKLVLCMSSCEGISAGSMAFTTAGPPFLALAGSPDSLDRGVNINWDQFYREWASSQDLGAAFSNLQAQRRGYQERFFLLTSAELQTSVSLQ